MLRHVEPTKPFKPVRYFKPVKPVKSVDSVKYVHPISLRLGKVSLGLVRLG